MLPWTLKASARCLSSGDGPEGLGGAGAEAEAEGAEVEGALEVEPPVERALVLRNTSKMEESVAGAIEYWALSVSESRSTPNDSLMHETANQPASSMYVDALLYLSYSLATSKLSLSSSLTVPSVALARRNSTL